MGKKILVVDDDPSVLKVLSLSLRTAGYDVLTCDHGKEAAGLAKRERPDLVIMDIMLEDTDGIESSAELKKEETTRNIPVIFLTGLQSRRDEREQGNEIAGRLIFAKPFDSQKLVQRIHALLDK